MGLFDRLTGKQKTIERDESGRITNFVSLEREIANPYVAGSNFITLFETTSEVFFPIDFIANRVSGANFVLKKTKDDSVIFDNKEMNKFLYNPNPITSFPEFIYSHCLYKLVTGNSYIKAAIPELYGKKKELWKYCENYWVLPADNVDIATDRMAKLFGVFSRSELIKFYRLSCGSTHEDISPEAILHSREANLTFNSDYLKGKSRLESQLSTISNLIAVYEARNVIYVKRGAIGWIVSKKKDETGSVALTPKEKEDLRKDHIKTYGIGAGQFPVGISNTDIGFVRTSLSIAELQPFDESFVDACQIAGAFRIPSVLIPRKDNSTFSNQLTAEKSVYSSMIIPFANQIARELTRFLGLEESGMYLDVDFSEVDVLQQGLKEKQEVRKIITDRCKVEFMNGVITLNDWRAQIGESMISDAVYNKLVFHMSDAELSMIGRFMNLKIG